MLQQIIAFFMAILAFFSSLLGLPVDTVAYTDVAYGTDERQVMDLYVPDGYDKTVGLVVMLHGGSWQRGDKSHYAQNIANDSAEYNVACASVNYRLLKYGGPITLQDIYDDITASIEKAVEIAAQQGVTTITLQDIYDDITASIEKAVEIAAQQGVTIDKVMMRGFSAGGHLALLYAYTQQDAWPIPVTAVYAESPVADMTDKDLYWEETIAWTENLCWLGSMMLDHTYTMETFDENIEYIKTISPAQCVRADSVPTLLTHGKKDTVVPFRNAQYLIDALEQSGAEYALVISETAGHGIGTDASAVAKAERLYEQYIDDYLN